ncbi:hypothetical protein ABZ319_29500 [Nocardia sp. NPDC005978]|uniref:hypothetical protein n=1 Tax=Nocardia sp. NPDC005978 TaxID=3156725 RepID=UPI0033B918F1
MRRLDPAEPGRSSAPGELVTVRRYLAAATEPDYRPAVERLAVLRAASRRASPPRTSRRRCAGARVRWCAAK